MNKYEPSNNNQKYDDDYDIDAICFYGDGVNKDKKWAEINLEADDEEINLIKVIIAIFFF